MGGADLRHKILAIVEEEGAEKASYALKLLQSEGELRDRLDGQGPAHGPDGDAGIPRRGAGDDLPDDDGRGLDEELQNRCLVLTVDESREQTERIHALQREARTEAGLARKAQRDELLALHRAAQALLQPLPVFNPYAEKLRFLSDRLRTRRDHEKYLLLIDALAVLFQHQREREDRIAGRELHRRDARRHRARPTNSRTTCSGRGLDDMPPQTRRLLGLVQQMQRERGEEDERRGRRALAAARAARLHRLERHAAKIHLGRLVELEYVLASRDPEHLNGQLYETALRRRPGGGRVRTCPA